MSDSKIKTLQNMLKQQKRFDLAMKFEHHCSASSANLQIIDYIGWAIYRKYEHNESSYYEMNKQYLLEEEVMTKDRIEVHYKK